MASETTFDHWKVVEEKWEKLDFLKTLSTSDFDLLEFYINLCARKSSNLLKSLFFSWCMFWTHVVGWILLRDQQIFHLKRGGAFNHYDHFVQGDSDRKYITATGLDLKWYCWEEQLSLAECSLAHSVLRPHPSSRPNNFSPIHCSTMLAHIGFLFSLGFSPRCTNLWWTYLVPYCQMLISSQPLQIISSWKLIIFSGHLLMIS